MPKFLWSPILPDILTFVPTESVVDTKIESLGRLSVENSPPNPSELLKTFSL